MATILFDVGDVFISELGNGVVLGEGRSVLITGNGRSGWTIDQGPVPADAIPIKLTKLNSYVQVAIRGALAAIGHPIVNSFDEEGQFLEK